MLRQSYEHWEALELGEEEGQEGKFRKMKLVDGTKEEKWAALKTIFQSREFYSYINNFQYIIKLDDDDMISPTLIESLSQKDFDCCYDDHHTFYEITSARLSQQRRSWIASTCVHKTEHAFMTYHGPGSSPVGNLLYSDHSASWHMYYSGKQKIVRPKESPVYLRILSPTSITANGGSGTAEDYSKYLSGFGTWKLETLDAFKQVILELYKCGELIEGFPVSLKLTLQPQSIIERIKNKISKSLSAQKKADNIADL
ncbi:MAG: hypothetical protein ACKVOR_02870 [Flavobacteriales bacterium]